MSRQVGYPYLISFNNKQDIKKVKYALDGYWINNRTLDCEDKETCGLILQSLKDMDIKNLDLGSFQLNMKYYSFDSLEYYFDNKKSKEKACKILEHNFRKDGYSWKVFANYHSKTKKYNKKYREKLMVNLELLKKQGIIYE